MADLYSIDKASLTTCICYICIAKLLHKYADIHNFFKHQIKPNSCPPDLDVIRSDESTLFQTSPNNSRFLVMAVPGYLTSLTMSSLFPAQPLYMLGKYLQPGNRCCTALPTKKARDRDEPVSFDAFFIVAPENTGTYMSFGLLVLQQLHSVMCIL